jgi:predicted CoA-substrate-specific enzyme activase
MDDVAGGLVLGVDVGSTSWKGVAVNAMGHIVAQHVEPTEPRIEAQTKRALVTLRETCGAALDTPLGATGYGRKQVPDATLVLTEITCHARGAFHLIHRPGVLIDFGGQDTKVIRFGEGGDVRDFAMNDKCAAGTGRFLEVILDRLEVTPADAPHLVAQAHRGVTISSTCTVFAESEVISLVAQGEPVPEIVMGLHRALASRVATLAGRVGEGEMIFMSGGVALNQAMADALVVALRRPIEVLPDPQLVGALGAALAVKN